MLLYAWDSPGKNIGVVAIPSPGDLPDPGIKPLSPALAGGFFFFFRVIFIYLFIFHLFLSVGG